MNVLDCSTQGQVHLYMEGSPSWVTGNEHTGNPGPNSSKLGTGNQGCQQLRNQRAPKPCPQYNQRKSVFNPVKGVNTQWPQPQRSQVCSGPYAWCGRAAAMEPRMGSWQSPVAAWAAHSPRWASGVFVQKGGHFSISYCWLSAFQLQTPTTLYRVWPKLTPEHVRACLAWGR